MAQGGTFLGSVVLARVLGKHAFGQYAMILTTVYALTSLAGLGLGITATKYVSQYRDKSPERAGKILGLSSAIAILAGAGFSVGLLVLAPSLATDPSLVPGLRVSVFYVFFSTLNGYQIGALVGFEAFGRIARISMVSGPAAVLAAWVLARLDGLRGAILAQGAVAFLIWLLYQIALRSKLQTTTVVIRYRGAWRERSALFRFSVPAIVSGITGSLVIWWCNNALVRHSGYAELAVFTAANNLRLMVLFVPALVARVVSPLLNNLLANGEVTKFRQAFWGAVAGNGIVALGLAAIFSVTGNQILRLFGKDFIGPPALLFLLLLAAVIEVVASNLYQVVFTAKSLWWQVVVQSTWTAVFLSFSQLLIPRQGATGLAQAYLAAWCASLVLYGMLTRVQEGLGHGRKALLYDSNSGV
jgi:O-antigen/teichoic acid export membrane protein